MNVSIGQYILKFIILGFLSFGGGYTFMSLMEGELVSKTGWLTNDELVLALTAGQITPGPVAVAGSFAGFLIGYKISNNLWQGLLYAFIAWIATNVATVTCMSVIMRFYRKIAGHPAAEFIMKLVMPAVIGLIFYLALKIGLKGMISYPQIGIAAVAFILARYSKIDYVFIIISGGIIGYFFLK